ncbi:MAG: hypothetical protein JNL21_32970 [Myxococcales bacterium]|nr:hypothetical protein [Myxococcales bacterium]
MHPRDPEHEAEDALPSLAAMIGALLDQEDDAEPEVEGAPRIESMTIELPVELALEAGESDALATRCSPPTQYTKTSVMPVFHKLRVRVVRSNGG